MLTALLGEQLDPTQGGLALGIDAAPCMIKVAARKRGTQTVQFQTAIAEDLPFPEASFDHACSAFFFHHVDYELKLAALRELRRVLRPGGCLAIIDVDTPTSLYGKVAMRAGEWLFKQPEIGENRRGLFRPALTGVGCRKWQAVDHWQGYITLFRWDSIE